MTTETIRGYKQFLVNIAASADFVLKTLATNPRKNNNLGVKKISQRTSLCQIDLRERKAEKRGTAS